MRTSTQSGASGQDAGLGSSAALASTLLLLGIGYALLATAPLVFQRFPTSALTVLSGAAWVPAAAASGLAVGGAAAFVFVLARLVRDLEREPYACLAPVLAVFTAFVLVGLRVKLPLPGIAGDHFSALAMAVSVVGGALLQRGGLLPALLGTLLALLPSAVLFGASWAASGTADVGAFLGALEPRLRIFLGLMAASALAMLGAALVSRATRKLPRVSVAQESLTLPRSMPREERAHAEDADALVWQRLRAEADGLPPRPRRITSSKMQSQVTAALDSIDLERLTWSGGFPIQERTQSGTPRWLMVLLALTTLGALGALGHRAYQWHQNDEAQAALEADAQRRLDARRVVAERAAAAERAKEAEAAASRLEALLAAPAVVPPPAVEPAVAPVDAEAAPAAVATVEEDDARKARREERARRRKARREERAQADRPVKLDRKSRAERAAAQATDRAVGGTLSSSSDPIYGL